MLGADRRPRGARARSPTARPRRRPRIGRRRARREGARRRSSIEPQLPAPLLAVVGEGPAAAHARRARAHDRLARRRDERRRAPTPSSSRRWATATRTLLAAALAGRRRLHRPRRERAAGATRRSATLRDAGRRRGGRRCASARPAGLDLGPSTQEEIAVAILAELVAWRHTRGRRPQPGARGGRRPRLRHDRLGRGRRPRAIEHEGVTVRLLLRRTAARGSRPSPSGTA